MANNRGIAEIHAEMRKLISALEEDNSLRDADRHSLIALHYQALAESNLEPLKDTLLRFEPPVSEADDAEKYLQLSESAAALLNLLYEKANLLQEEAIQKQAEAVDSIASAVALLNPNASLHQEELAIQKQEEAVERIASAAVLLNPNASPHQEVLAIQQQEEPAERIASAAALLNPKADPHPEELAIQQQEEAVEAVESIADVNGEQNLNARQPFYFGEIPEPPLKLVIRQILSNDMTQYTKLGGKNGGARSAGKNGGVYKTQYTYSTPAGDLVENDQLILFKQDTDNNGRVIHDNVIAEYVAAKIMQYFVGDSAASVILATDGKTPLPDETGDNVYVGSVYYEDRKSVV